MRLNRVVQALVVVALLSAAYFGWREFWFLTDDAHITFRYISSHRLGWGYAFNPPPFAPVEGYSNFLWMVLLEAVWLWTGVEPPDASNSISFLFSLGTLGLGFVLVRLVNLPEPYRSYRFLLGAVVVAATLSNGTFLTWMTSGLEEALYIFCVTGWVACLLWYSRSRHFKALVFACTAGAACALTRPDGALFAAASFAAVCWVMLAERRIRAAAAALPLLAVAAHILWRKSYYGEWVPNTYFAKYDSPWPAAGLRYLAVFVIEYSLWTLPLIGAFALWRLRARDWRRSLDPFRLLIAGALAAHFGYFTILIGGDHFEFRVYAHLVLLLWVGTVALIAALGLKVRTAAALFVAIWALSLPLGWVHHLRTRSLPITQFGEVAVTRIADAFPWPLSAYVGLYDDTRYWLASRLISIRRHEHSEVAKHFMTMYPPREEGQHVRWNEVRALMPRGNPGIAGWQLPEVAIIDTFGLADRVVARHPMSPEHENGLHKMAHAREPPAGYVECFLPNAVPTDKGLVITQRPEPLTDERIRKCEADYSPRR